MGRRMGSPDPARNFGGALNQRNPDLSFASVGWNARVQALAMQLDREALASAEIEHHAAERLLQSRLMLVSVDIANRLNDAGRSK